MGEVSKAASAVERLRSSNAERVADSDLILIADVVRHVVKDTKAALRDSAESVLDDLVPDAAGLFIVRPGDSPVSVTPNGPHALVPSALLPGPGRRILSRGIGSDGARVPTPSQAAAPTPSLQPGRAGWLELLRLIWVTSSPRQAGDTHLDFDAGAHVAIRRTDSETLFGVGGVAAVRHLQPAPAGNEAATTPLRPTVAELLKKNVGEITTEVLDEAFRMRHVDGESEDAIATALNMKRQGVADRIGGKTDQTFEGKPRKKFGQWKASDSLLLECGKKRKEGALQSVASNLTKTRR